MLVLVVVVVVMVMMVVVLLALDSRSHRRYGATSAATSSEVRRPVVVQRRRIATTRAGCHQRHRRLLLACATIDMLAQRAARGPPAWWWLLGWRLLLLLIIVLATGRNNAIVRGRLIHSGCSGAAASSLIAIPEGSARGGADAAALRQSDDGRIERRRSGIHNGQNYVLQSSILVGYLVYHVARRHLNRNRNWWGLLLRYQGDGCRARHELLLSVEQLQRDALARVHM